MTGYVGETSELLHSLSLTSKRNREKNLKTLHIIAIDKWYVLNKIWREIWLFKIITKNFLISNLKNGV